MSTPEDREWDADQERRESPDTQAEPWIYDKHTDPDCGHGWNPVSGGREVCLCCSGVRSPSAEPDGEALVLSGREADQLNEALDRDGEAAEGLAELLRSQGWEGSYRRVVEAVPDGEACVCDPGPEGQHQLDRCPAPAQDDAEVEALAVSVAIKAQNPTLERAWQTLAWWEQTCTYWKKQAEKGYRLRDSLVAREAADAADRSARDAAVAAKVAEQIAQAIEAEKHEPRPGITGFNDGLNRAARIARAAAPAGEQR